MRKLHRAVLLVLLLGFMTSLSACRASSPPAAPGPSMSPLATLTPHLQVTSAPVPVPKAAIERGGTVVYPITEAPPSFDLHAESSYALAQPATPLYNGLMTPDVYSYPKLAPDLAESWEVASDGTSVAFYLRRGVQFHDGSEFTCQDARYSVDKLADSKRSTLGGVFVGTYAGAECEDAATLVIRLKRPTAAFLSVLASSRSVMMKKDAWETRDPKAPDQYLIGTGPFRFKAWTPGVEFQAERNARYWKPGLPYIEGYRTVIMPDLTSIFAAFRARQLTMTGIARHLEKPDADVLKRDFPDAIVALGPRSAWDTFVMNVTKVPFHDRRVRQAVALATDKEKMIQIAAEGWGSIGGIMAPSLPYALPNEELRRLPQFGVDLEARRAQAKRLLAEAGYPNGLTEEYLVRKGPLYERGAIARHDDLRKVGIELEVILLDTATIVKRFRAREFTVYTSPGTIPVDDPDLVYNIFQCGNPNNFSGYCDAEFDRLYQEQQGIFDGAKRAQVTRQMERILLRDVPDDRGYFWWSAMGYWPSLQNWVPIQGTTVFDFGRFEQVWCRGGRCR